MSFFNIFCDFQGVEDEDRQWNEKADDEDEFDIPYSFVANKLIPENNSDDITLPSTVSH